MASEKWMYLRVLLFGLGVFGLCYLYTHFMGIPGVLNKSVADASIILIGLSMWLSSLSYFFNVFDKLIRYRKHLGLIGFAFGVTHIILSFSALQRLFNPAVWQTSAVWAPLTGLLATLIFTIMTVISNRATMTKLGILTWRRILRTGYIAMLLVQAHVILLKSGRWITWFEGGMKTPPSLSLMVTIFMTVVVLMRLLMWWRIAASPKPPTPPQSPPAPLATPPASAVTPDSPAVPEQPESPVPSVTPPPTP